MKRLIGNGPENTTFKGAINPGSNLSIESAALGDVNVYGGTLSIQGGVVLNGVATTSGTAAVAFTGGTVTVVTSSGSSVTSTVVIQGGTIGTGGYVAGTAYIDSAILGDSQTLTSEHSVVYIGSGGSMFDLNNGPQISMGPNVSVSALGIVFSGGSSTNVGILRTSNGSAYYSNCVFSGCSVTANGLFYQLGNTARVEFEDCMFSGNFATSNYAVFLRANNGYTRFASCTITGNTARGYILGATGAGDFRLSNCVFSSNTVTTNSPIGYTAGAKGFLESCVFSANSSTERLKNGRTLILGGTVSVVDCYAEPLVSAPAATAGVYISATCVCTISGGTYGTVQCPSSNTTLAGNLNFTYFSSGTVNITSGTSIALTSNMSCTAINVDGGCVLPGAVVSAGVYTNIDNTGRAS